MRRRSFLTGLGLLGGAACFGGPLAFASAPTDKRLVVVVLRGGMDGLAAVPAHGDPQYRAARGEAVVEDVLDLDGTFGLHPALAPLIPLWERRELLPVHAVAPPYHQRSHFDGQDVLENGTDLPFGASTGWLNRALGSLTGAPVAMAVGKTVPLILRGAARVTSADPLRPARPDDPWLHELLALYSEDPALGAALEEGLATQRMLASHQVDLPQRVRPGDPVTSSRILGRVMADPDGPRIAVLEAGGWDTHTGQEGALDRNLAGLGGAIAAFSEGAGAAWDDTVVLAVTEFGRTVRGNGTGGSDHGIGGAALLAGGALAGGTVRADWPGLRTEDLVEGRDLRPTTDLRAVFKGVLRDHLGVSAGALDREVFPGSAEVAPLDGLIRS